MPRRAAATLARVTDPTAPPPGDRPYGAGQPASGEPVTPPDPPHGTPSGPGGTQPAEPPPTELMPAADPTQYVPAVPPPPQVDPGLTQGMPAADQPTEFLPAQPGTELMTRRSLREGGASTDGAAPGGGILAILRKHPRAWLAGALSVAFVILGTSALFAGVAVGSNSSAAAPITSTPVPDPRPTPNPAPGAVPIRSCSIAGPASDGLLMDFYGTVMRADDGTVLFDRQGTTPASTGSVMKVLTAARATASHAGSRSSRAVQPRIAAITSTITAKTFDSTVKKLKKFQITVGRCWSAWTALSSVRASCATTAAAMSAAAARRRIPHVVVRSAVGAVSV